MRCRGSTAAVARLPAEPEFHNNLGLVLAALDRHDEAIAAHRRALALQPVHAGAWNNLGLALTAANALDDAIAAFDRALELAPSLTEARFNRALALLAAGRFAEGFRDYEARLAVPAFADPAWSPTVPRWDGSAPHGRTILLVAEQGLGDAIQFVRLATTLAARGARVIVQAPRALAALLRTVAGVAGVVAPGEPLPPHDAWLPLLSLAGTLGIDAASIPARVPYLTADASRRREIATTLAAQGDVLRAGLAWAGNPRNTNDRRRSAPLAALAPLLSVPGVAWFSLSKDDGEEQVRRRTGSLATGGARRATRLRRHRGARRGARPRGHRRHEHRPPRRSARAADVRAAALPRRLALAHRARGQRLVSDRQAVPPARARRLGAAWSRR